METHEEKPEPAEEKRSRWLFFVILGVIVFFFGVLLVLKPRG
jgi:hypothetical protein